MKKINKKKLIITDSEFLLLQNSGMCCPRDKEGRGIKGVTVGSRYIVKSGLTNEEMVARCSQSQPITLKPSPNALDKGEV